MPSGPEENLHPDSHRLPGHGRYHYADRQGRWRKLSRGSATCSVAYSVLQISLGHSAEFQVVLNVPEE